MNTIDKPGAQVPFRTVVRAERDKLRLPTEMSAPQGVALALSGGGIRSASFALGVVQSFVNRGCFKTFDYLSTVSGGGYLGTALTWLKKQYGVDFERQLGSRVRGDRTSELLAEAGGTRAERQSDTSAESAKSSSQQQRAPSDNTWLDYVRLHGNYLQPPSISTLSLVGVVIRGLLFTLLVYGGAAVALVTLLSTWHVLPVASATHCTQQACWQSIDRWVLAFACVLGFQIVLYGLATWLTSMPRWPTAVLSVVVTGGMFYWFVGSLVRAQGVWDSHWPYEAALGVTTLFCVWLSVAATLVLRRKYAPLATGETWERVWHYHMRTTLQQVLGAVLGITLALLVLWSVPAVHDWLHDWRNWAPGVAGLGSTGVSAVLALWRFMAKQSEAKSSPKPNSGLTNLLVICAAAVVIYGGLILAYAVSVGTVALPFHPASGTEPGLNGAAAALLGGGALVLGFLCNVNYLSLGRVYRDRLMEMFMPNRNAINTVQWERATEAELAKVTDFVDVRPYHLINCNVVLVDSESDSFRGRGGDNFLLAPLYSGSSATQWVNSVFLSVGGVLKATAMAASGAAANPDAGVAGSGLTRNRLVSFLMWFFNVRLGYWIANPAASFAGKLVNWGPPNFWFPGFWQGLLGRGLRENAAFVELTDGGHFDNTGLYELIRRRVRVIVLSEAGADPEFKMEDIANAIERVRVDFGVHIRFDVPGFDIQAIRPSPTATVAERGFAVANIYYPELPESRDTPEARPENQKTGYLLYLQATPVKAITDRVDIDAYRRVHPAFPNDTTADQFFDEDQLEAYRELGLEVAEQAIARLKQARASDQDPIKELALALGLGS